MRQLTNEERHAIEEMVAMRLEQLETARTLEAIGVDINVDAVITSAQQMDVCIFRLLIDNFLYSDQSPYELESTEERLDALHVLYARADDAGWSKKQEQLAEVMRVWKEQLAEAMRVWKEQVSAELMLAFDITGDDLLEMRAAEAC